MPAKTKDESLPTFVLKKPTDFWWTVRIPIAVDDDYQQAKLEVLFLALDQAELDKLRGQNLAKDESVPTDGEVVQRVVRGWRGMLDEAGNPVPFSAEMLAELMRVPMARTAVVATYFAATSGMAARKNG